MAEFERYLTAEKSYSFKEKAVDIYPDTSFRTCWTKRGVTTTEKRSRASASLHKTPSHGVTTTEKTQSCYF
jgi:hypothetical protein